MTIVGVHIAETDFSDPDTESDSSDSEDEKHEEKEDSSDAEDEKHDEAPLEAKCKNTTDWEKENNKCKKKGAWR